MEWTIFEFYKCCLAPKQAMPKFSIQLKLKKAALKEKKKELSSTYTIKALTKYSHKSIKLKPIEQFWKNVLTLSRKKSLNGLWKSLGTPPSPCCTYASWPTYKIVCTDNVIQIKTKVIGRKVLNYVKKWKANVVSKMHN